MERHRNRVSELQLSLRAKESQQNKKFNEIEERNEKRRRSLGY